MNRLTACSTLIVLSVGFNAYAQAPRDHSEDDRIIREKVAKSDAMFTEDAIIWQGGFVRPFRISEKNRDELRHPPTRNLENVKIATTIETLQFSEAGDMAYEYSTSQVSYDRTDDKRHVDVVAPSLRVWRKMQGQWKIAAVFSHPNEHTLVAR